MILASMGGARDLQSVSLRLRQGWEIFNQGPPGYQAYPAWQTNPNYDENSGGPNLFLRWANWSNQPSNSTYLFRVDASIVGGSDDLTLAWTLQGGGSWDDESGTGQLPLTRFVGHVGATGVQSTANLILQVTDNANQITVQGELLLQTNRSAA